MTDTDLARPGHDVPLFPRVAPATSRVGRLERARTDGLSSESTLVFGLMLVALVAHGLNMFQYPSFTWLADEGTYVSEAWAVLRLGQLAHYTYMYGHVPGSWILLAGLTLVTGGPRALDMPVNTARLFMLVLHVAMVPLLYRLARKLGAAPSAAALAVFVFSVSPLAIFYQRIFLLDNVMLFWTLLSLVLLLDDGGRLSRFALSGLCFGLALLCKETDVFLVPVVLAMVRQWRRPHHGRFAMVAWLLPMVAITSWYPLYAALKGELLPAGFVFQVLGLTVSFATGPHVSLVEALAWQGGRGGGAIFDLGNQFWSNAEIFWLPRDSALLVGGTLAIAINFARGVRRGRRPLVAGGLLGLMPLVYLDHGGVVFQHYILFAIPFLCLNLALAVTPALSRLPARSAGAVAGAAAVLLLAYYLQTGALQPLYVAQPSQTGREVIVWIKQNLPADSAIVTRDSFWPDLHETGLGGAVFPNVHDHWQVATNPAVRDSIFKNDWHLVDYLLMMPDMLPIFREANNTVALDAYANSCLLRSWQGDDGNTIRLWRVDKTGASLGLPYGEADSTCPTPATRTASSPPGPDVGVRLASVDRRAGSGLNQ